MNLGALVALAKLIVDSGAVSPKAPTDDFVGPRQYESGCYRVDGKLTQACWEKFIQPGGSYNDYQDYLNEK
jgi:hypothetical protein